MAREITILRQLDHPNIVKLEGLATSRMQYSIYLVLEFMRSDLARLISRPERLTEPQVYMFVLLIYSKRLRTWFSIWLYRKPPWIGISLLGFVSFCVSKLVMQIKFYMHQLLSGLQHCHGRGILHRDIKGSNLLIDKNGMLKIGDFGLANYFTPNQKRPLTNRVVTLWYRAPELLLGATNYGVAIDLWSAGCLLAEMFSGRPIMPGRTEVITINCCKQDDNKSLGAWWNFMKFREKDPISQLTIEQKKVGTWSENEHHVISGRATTQDFQALWHTIRGLLEKIEIIYNFQASSNVQARSRRSFQWFPYILFGPIEKSSFFGSCLSWLCIISSPKWSIRTRNFIFSLEI